MCNVCIHDMCVCAHTHTPTYDGYVYIYKYIYIYTRARAHTHTHTHAHTHTHTHTHTHRLPRSQLPCASSSSGSYKCANPVKSLSLLPPPLPPGALKSEAFLAFLNKALAESRSEEWCVQSEEDVVAATAVKRKRREGEGGGVWGSEGRDNEMICCMFVCMITRGDERER